MKCVWNINFFTGQAITKLTFVLQFRQDILHTEFGLIWTTPWPDQRDLFLKFVIREIRSLSYEKLIFFSETSYSKNSFSPALNLHWGLSIPILVVFGEILEPMKKDYFQNSIIKIYSKKSQIFQGKLCQMFLLLNTLITLVILHTKCGLIWATP